MQEVKVLKKMPLPLTHQSGLKFYVLKFEVYGTLVWNKRGIGCLPFDTQETAATSPSLIQRLSWPCQLWSPGGGDIFMSHSHRVRWSLYRAFLNLFLGDASLALWNREKMKQSPRHQKADNRQKSSAGEEMEWILRNAGSLRSCQIPAWMSFP